MEGAPGQVSGLWRRTWTSCLGSRWLPRRSAWWSSRARTPTVSPSNKTSSRLPPGGLGGRWCGRPGACGDRRHPGRRARGRLPVGVDRGHLDGPRRRRRAAGCDGPPRHGQRDAGVPAARRGRADPDGRVRARLRAHRDAVRGARDRDAGRRRRHRRFDRRPAPPAPGDRRARAARRRAGDHGRRSQHAGGRGRTASSSSAAARTSCPSSPRSRRRPRSR